MRRLYLYFMMALLFVGTTAFALPRTFNQAKVIAERQAAKLGIKIDNKAAAKAPSINGSMTTILSPYYVFPFGDDKGFVIISGDDDMPEIVGYADHGTYNADNMPTAMTAFLKNYCATIEAVKRGNTSAIKNIAEAKAMRANQTRSTTAISPLLGDIKWDQSTPYNNMCPKYDGTNVAATGCVATAMAQVMMYWKYPNELRTDIPQYTTYTQKIVMSAESKGQKYDWDNMIPNYSYNYTKTQADAVAKLMLHCGKAVKMNYNKESGANVTPASLAKYFGYDSDLMLDLPRSSFTLAEWTALIDQELQARRPILYSGQTTAGGHQFICDGSDGNGLYHINWGWSGAGDGYFDITILNPSQGGIGAGNISDGFNRSCYMIIGIQPDNGKVDEPLTECPFVMVLDGSYNGHSTGIELTKPTRKSATDKFTITIKEWWGNPTSNHFKGKLGYGISDGKGGYQLISKTTDLELNAVQEDGSGNYTGTTFTIDYAFPPTGTYTIYAIYSTDNGKTWKKCGYEGMRPYVVKSSLTKLSLVKTQLTADIATEEKNYNGIESTFKLSVTNNSDDEFMGLINLYTSSTTTQPDDAVEGLYMTVPAHSTVTRNVGITPSTAGNMYVWVEDSEGKELLLNAKKFNVEQTTEPSLVLEKVETNATPYAYERKNARYSTNNVKVPRVDDDKAEFKYYIRNDGGTTSVKCWLIAFNAETGKGPYTEKTIRIPGNGSTTTISYEFTPEQIGGNTLMGELRLFNTETNVQMNIPTSLPKIKYYVLVDGKENGYYEINAINPLVYVAGKPNAINDVTNAATNNIHGGISEITIITDKAERIAIYHIDGSKVCDVRTEANTIKHVTVAPGLYIVKGKKVVVR